MFTSPVWRLRLKPALIERFEGSESPFLDASWRQSVLNLRSFRYAFMESILVEVPSYTNPL